MNCTLCKNWVLHYEFSFLSDAGAYMYASCQLEKDILVGSTRDVSGTIDMRQMVGYEFI